MDSGPTALIAVAVAEHTKSNAGKEVTGDDGHNDSGSGHAVPGAGPRPRPPGPPVRWVPMRARVGDRLIVGEDRIGEVLGVPSADGSPPYIIKWLKDGHIAMVLPDQYSRIVAVGEAVVTGDSETAV
jgi:uncharacterized protein DUF1918